MEETMRMYVICLFLLTLMGPAGTFKANADEVPDETVDGLALQYMYMELCKDIAPPLPPDRLRVIDALTEIVDRKALLKAVCNARRGSRSNVP
jgi:hypothetical protein